jgi:hypothetical protein
LAHRLGFELNSAPRGLQYPYLCFQGRKDRRFSATPEAAPRGRLTPF